MKTYEYCLVTYSNRYTLQSEVNRLLKEGWQPYGPPFASNPGSMNGEITQAMIKQENIENS